LFFPIPSDLFFTKGDPEDIRLGELFKNYQNELTADDFVVIGYPDDEGIRLNGGRVGAAQAPDKIRQFLYKMTPPENYYLSAQRTQFVDFGNLEIKGDLGLRHENAKKALDLLHQNHTRIISFGGGHDYGYSDGASFIKKYFKTFSDKPIIINFDAHLDVRKTTNGLNSGTPFFRLLQEFKNQFHLIEVGLQSQCNSVHHLRWAQDQGVETFFIEEIDRLGLDVLFKKSQLATAKKTTPVFVSFDIDALSAAEAGGCSQAWATGLKTNDCIRFLNQLYNKTNVRQLGIYEVSPPLDRDFQTSKTAALLAHRFIFANFGQD